VGPSAAESRCIWSGDEITRPSVTRPASVSTRTALVFTPPISQPRMVVLEWVMQLIPVLDVARGVAVHARGGDRARYRPVVSVLTPRVAGDPVALVQAYRDFPGVRECYVADLDAIQGGPIQHGLLRALASAAAPCGLLMDAGISDASVASDLLAAGAGRLVVGLETLRRFDDLAAVLAAAGRERVVFSLDLRHGSVVTDRANLEADAAGVTAMTLVDRAVSVGVRTLLLLDVGRVGTGSGVDLRLLEAVRRRFPAEELLAGGGVGSAPDLVRMRDAGCDGALVATVLHRGRVGPADVRALTAREDSQSSASTSR
jgi:phosphoribosylformimino-5-aminoimidazole carboxamide ribotide isomerase